MSWERVAIGIGVVAAAVILLALLWPVARHRLIYPGGTLAPERSAPSAHGLPHGAEIWLEADDGIRIHAWWVPARPQPGGSGPDTAGSAGTGSDGAAARGAVVYCHGNAETMATRAWIADRLSRLGYHTLLFDYRGYGLSGGRASEEGLARDARAAWEHVLEARGVPPGRVALMGHSLGSAVATRLALDVEPEDGSTPEGDDTGPAALIVGAPFPSMPALFAHHAPWLPDRALRWSTDRLDAGSRLGEVMAPKLVVIGTEDDVVPPEMSRGVHEAAVGANGEDGGGAESRDRGADRGTGVEDGVGRGEAERGDEASPVLVTVAADHATMMSHPAVWAALERFLDSTLPGSR